jgi:hypothetical protein
LNGANVTAPASLTGKTPGVYSLGCFDPPGYRVSNVSPNQTLVAGGSVSLTVFLAAIPPPVQTPPGLNGVTSSVNPPKAGQAFNATLSGSGFTSGSQGWVCNQAQFLSNGSCHSPQTNFINGSTIVLPSVVWNASTAYFMVMNGTLQSSFVGLVVK